MARLGWQKDKKWRQLWPRERGEEQKLRGGIPNQNTLVNSKLASLETSPSCNRMKLEAFSPRRLERSLNVALPRRSSRLGYDYRAAPPSSWGSGNWSLYLHSGQSYR
jgi:hypothetical protein